MSAVGVNHLEAGLFNNELKLAIKLWGAEGSSVGSLKVPRHKQTRMNTKIESTRYST